MFQLFKSNEEEVSAVFDIGNGSIGGALVRFKKNGIPTILFSKREPLTFMPSADSEKLIDYTVKLIKSLAADIAKNGKIDNNRIYCVFAAPWFVAQTKVIKDSQLKPCTVTKNSIDTIVKKEQDQFNELVKSGKYADILGSDSIIMEKKILKTKLNGYEVDDPIGKKAKELELTVFSSYISKGILEQIDVAVRSSLVAKSIEHVSYAMASWGGCRAVFPEVFDHFFIDVSGENTDVSLVLKDVLVENASFPIGRSSLLRAIVKDLNITPDVALSYLKMSLEKTLDNKSTDEMQKIFSAFTAEWRNGFFAVLSEFQKNYTLPSSIFLTVDQDCSGFFVDSLRASTPIEMNVPQNSFSVHYMNADVFKRFLGIAPGKPLDPFLAIESVFLENNVLY